MTRLWNNNASKKQAKHFKMTDGVEREVAQIEIQSEIMNTISTDKVDGQTHIEQTCADSKLSFRNSDTLVVSECSESMLKSSNWKGLLREFKKFLRSLSISSSHLSKLKSSELIEWWIAYLSTSECKAQTLSMFDNFGVSFNDIKVLTPWSSQILGYHQSASSDDYKRVIQTLNLGSNVMLALSLGLLIYPQKLIKVDQDIRNDLELNLKIEEIVESGLIINDVLFNLTLKRVKRYISDQIYLSYFACLGFQILGWV